MATISSICSRICSGGTPKSTESSYYGGTIPWLNTKEIDFNIIESTEKTITEDGLNNSSAKWVEAPCVIVAMYGATAGKVAISNIRLTTNQACCNLNIDSGKADYRFVYYALKNDFTRLSSLANGGAQQNLNAQQIKDFDTPDFSLSEQKKIAEILSSLDEKIETNRKINARLEELAQALFKSWFIDFEPFDGQMPEDWEASNFDDAIEVIAGGTPKTEVKEYWDGDIPWISVKDFVNETHFVMNTERYISQKGLDNSSTHLLNPDDTIISARGTVGAIAQIQVAMAFNQSCFGLRCKLNNGAHWLFYLIHNKVAELRQKSHGSVFDTINRKTLSDLQIAIPTSEILSKFHFIISPIVEKSLLLSKESARLAALRDALLPKLMSGELIPE